MTPFEQKLLSRLVVALEKIAVAMAPDPDAEHSHGTPDQFERLIAAQEESNRLRAAELASRMAGKKG